LPEVRPAKNGEIEPPEVAEYRRDLELYRRSTELKPILSKIHDISQGRSDKAVTCGIGIIRKKLKDGTVINSPLLEIDLSLRPDRNDCYEFSPESTLLPGSDSGLNQKIRLCTTLSKLEASPDPQQHTLQKTAQKILEHFIRCPKRQDRDQINPFDSTTYQSLLKRIGRALDPCFSKTTKWNQLSSQARDVLKVDQAAGTELEIVDTWVVFHRPKAQASRVVSQDAQKFIEELLRDQPDAPAVPPLWEKVATNTPVVDVPPSLLDDSDFLLPLQQNEAQLDILKKIESNDCVVVQGPPGTGKSHTIGEVARRARLLLQLHYHRHGVDASAAEDTLLHMLNTAAAAADARASCLYCKLCV
jgi:hypothetical protein